MGLGVQMVLTMVLCAAGGYYLDRWLGTEPWLLLAGTLLGMVSVFTYLIRLANQISKKSNPHPRKDRAESSDEFPEPDS